MSFVVDHQIIPKKAEYQQVFSSDEQEYGGLGSYENRQILTGEEGWNGFPYSLTLQIPKQSVIVLEKKGTEQ